MRAFKQGYEACYATRGAQSGNNGNGKGKNKPTSGKIFTGGLSIRTQRKVLLYITYIGSYVVMSRLHAVAGLKSSNYFTTNEIYYRSEFMFSLTPGMMVTSMSDFMFPIHIRYHTSFEDNTGPTCKCFQLTSIDR